MPFAKCLISLIYMLIGSRFQLMLIDWLIDWLISNSAGVMRRVWHWWLCLIKWKRSCLSTACSVIKSLLPFNTLGGSLTERLLWWKCFEHCFPFVCILFIFCQHFNWSSFQFSPLWNLNHITSNSESFNFTACRSISDGVYSKIQRVNKGNVSFYMQKNSKNNYKLRW